MCFWTLWFQVEPQAARRAVSLRLLISALLREKRKTGSDAYYVVFRPRNLWNPVPHSKREERESKSRILWDTMKTPSFVLSGDSHMVKAAVVVVFWKNQNATERQRNIKIWHLLIVILMLKINILEVWVERTKVIKVTRPEKQGRPISKWHYLSNTKSKVEVLAHTHTK